ncbi:MAG TPA: DUF2889 domain-containing protein [Steroidobacteraceae bacterium]|nr:DUF2889 domain-containing protein [Steroidobacteraceae bacterium]
MLKPDPAYGHGIFRRGVRLAVASGEVKVDLEDGNHAFRMVLRHDGSRITAIDTEAVRHPFTTCPEAGKSVQVLVGRPLEAVREVRRLIETPTGCTHLTDMAGLAIAHVKEPGLRRLYEIAVDDECDARTRARIGCDGQPIHDWTIVRHLICEPKPLAGRPLMKGFHAWAATEFLGLALEAATMLQRGYFVAQSRRYSASPASEHPAISDAMPEGVCYSYTTPAVQRAQRIDGSRRDFTNDTDALLRFWR